ncbi:MAG: hypothetical protein HFJ52_03095 [Clostridia bacterium]|nr:hypothetical protein [Clostridia bacterium]
MKNNYNFEIGLQFKDSATFTQKQNLYEYIENYMIDLDEKETKNESILIIYTYTNQISSIKRILENSKIIRYFYIESFKKEV